MTHEVKVVGRIGQCVCAVYKHQNSSYSCYVFTPKGDRETKQYINYQDAVNEALGLCLAINTTNDEQRTERT